MTVPTNSILTIHKQTVMIHPIRDEYWSPNPSQERSMEFAQTKGQTITNGNKEVITATSSHATKDLDSELLRLNISSALKAH